MIIVRDSFAMELPDLVPEKLKIFDSSYQASHGPQDLYIKVKATHAGLINGNKSFYVPYRMADSVHTWTSPYPKPFNPYHYDSDRPRDPIGRVIDAKYVDTSKGLPASISKYVEGIIADRGKDKLYSDIGKLLKKKVLQDENWEGLGYIELLIKVVDPESIQKILDGRLMTGSVAAGSDSLVCYYCKQDIKYGHCGHMRGMMVTDDVLDIEYPNFYVYGNFEYLEFASEPIPADKFATWEVTSETKLADGDTISATKMYAKDCMAQVTSVFVASRDEDFMTSLIDKNDVNIYELRDSLQEVQEIMGAVNKDKEREMTDKEIKDRTNELLKLAKSGEIAKIQEAIDAFKPETLAEKMVFVRVHNNLHSMVKWDGIKILTPAEKKFHAKIHELASQYDFNADLNWPGDGLDATLVEFGVTIPKEYKSQDSKEGEPDAKDSNDIGTPIRKSFSLKKRGYAVSF